MSVNEKPVFVQYSLKIDDHMYGYIGSIGFVL